MFETSWKADTQIQFGGVDATRRVWHVQLPPLSVPRVLRVLSLDVDVTHA